MLVEFKILGPLEVVAGGRVLPLRGARQRALLALLLIRANEVVSADRLIDDLWGERPPATARASLQNMVAKLRRLLGVTMLETRAQGYVLRLEPEQLDSARFEQLRRQAADEPAEERVHLLETALRLWRGLPLIDVLYEDFAQVEIGRLDELRLMALEDLCAARLETGAVCEAVADLQSLVGLYPYRERLRHQLMLALYRSGRAVDALVTYDEWRALLRDEWDAEPGKALERTAAAIRAQSPELEEAVL